MINMPDVDGNTPLHIAIVFEREDCLQFLMDEGADHSLRNKDFHGPVHLCTHLMKPKMLEVLLKHPRKPDVNLSDKLGGIALHYTAFTDDIESAKILVKYDCDHYKFCRNNFMPIHIAAHCGSYRVLDLFIKESKQLIRVLLLEW